MIRNLNIDNDSETKLIQLFLLENKIVSPLGSQSMKKQNFFFTFILMFLYSSCGQNPSPLQFSVNDTSNLSLNPGDKVTFSQIKAEILTPHCISCHSSVGTEANLKKWISAGNPNNSLFFTTVESGSMPQNQQPLSTSALELIRLYIQQMVTTTPTPTPPTTGITYAQIKAAVLTPYRCVNCHSVGTESQLAKWINTSTPSRSTFYTYITSGSMPPSGSQPTAEIEAMVLQYVKDFANR